MKTKTCGRSNKKLTDSEILAATCKVKQREQ